MLSVAFVICTFLLIQLKESNAATATILAGTGTSDYTGDGGPATSAQLNFPTGVWADSNGNTFFVDYTAAVVRKVDTSGIITTVGGTGTSANSNSGGAFTSVALNSPWGIAGDTNYLYISDATHIWKYDRSSGNVAIYAGNSVAGSTGNNGQATLAQVTQPAGMWLTSGGVLYFAESASSGQVVRAVSVNGIVTVIAGTTGSTGSSGDGGQATSAKLSSPASVYVDTNGIVYIADRANAKIRYVSSGIINTFAGGGGNSGDGFVATSTTLTTPYDVKGDTFGNIYMSESNKIRIVDSQTNLVSTYLSSLQLPRGLWVDASFSRTLVAQNAYIKTSTPFVSAASPTAAPSTISPSAVPSASPTTVAPSTLVPTAAPTATPSATPTAAPTTSVPSAAPTTSVPTADPTYAPSAAPSTTVPTLNPSANPTVSPSQVPTAGPTVTPTVAPSVSPSATPSAVPSASPTAAPNNSPTTPSPTTAPTPVPSTTHPSVAPSSAAPNRPPTIIPTAVPSTVPTAGPTNAPTTFPTATPTFSPTEVNRDVVQISATPRVKFIYGEVLNDLSLDTLVEAFQNISIDAQTTVITSTSLVSSSGSLASRETNVRRVRSISLASNSRISYTHDISFMSSYVMTYHLGYTSQQIATMKTTTIRQAIESGGFEKVLRSLAKARNATQLLNETSHEVMSITSSIVSPSSSSGSHGTDWVTIVVVVCVLGGAVVLCILLFFYKKYQQDEGQRTNKVYVASSYDKEEETI